MAWHQGWPLWQIDQNRYDIEDFYIDRNGGAGLLSIDDKMTLLKDKKEDLKLIDAHKSWKR